MALFPHISGSPPSWPWGLLTALPLSSVLSTLARSGLQVSSNQVKCASWLACPPACSLSSLLESCGLRPTVFSPITTPGCLASLGYRLNHSSTQRCCTSCCKLVRCLAMRPLVALLCCAAEHSPLSSSLSLSPLWLSLVNSHIPLYYWPMQHDTHSHTASQSRLHTQLPLLLSALSFVVSCKPCAELWFLLVLPAL